MAEKFHGHLDKVQETIQEALAALPDQDDMEGLTDQKKSDVKDTTSASVEQDPSYENSVEKEKDAILCDIVNSVEPGET